MSAVKPSETAYTSTSDSTPIKYIISFLLLGFACVYTLRSNLLGNSFEIKYQCILNTLRYVIIAISSSVKEAAAQAGIKFTFRKKKRIGKSRIAYPILKK